MADNTYDVFLSYSRADARHAAEIDSVLRDKGLKIFFDRRNLAAGLPWVRALEQAIGAAKATIVLIGPRGLGNTQQYERELAFVRQTRDPAFLVVPVILPETTTDPPFDFLRVLTWIDFSHVTRVSDAPDVLGQLLRAIHGQSMPAETARDAICPYRGLDAFREEDAAFFFGRGSADDPNSPIGELIRKVREHPFVMVVGRSGSGKSSLVYAGLLPALRREHDRFWNVLSVRPGPEPLRALAAAFNPRSEDEGAAEYAKRITKEADELRTGDPELLSHMIREQLDQAEGKPDRLLLYIDQWEELYAQAPPSSNKERAAQHAADVNRFIDLLLRASQSAPVAVVGTVRADFYDPLIGHQEIKSLLPTRQVLLGKMLRSELESTIVEPARKVGLTFDPPKLVQRILDDAGEDEGMLPLLQYALKETWARRQGNRLTGDSYTRSGGVREAIRITAERTFDELSPADQQVARQLFLRLVTPGEGQEDTRARAAMPVDEAQRKIVEQFAAQRTRLLVTGYDRAARPTVEVAHEALIRTWPRLRQWIDSNREKLRSRAAILQAKTDWEQNGKRDDMLLSAGLQLERARSLLADPGDITTDDIEEFITLSSAREEAERKEREGALERDKAQVARIASSQRITRWAFAAVAAVILIAGGIVAWWQADKARLQADKAEQLARQEVELAESRQQLDEARANVSAGQASNAELRSVLDRRQVDLDHAQANFLAELSATKLSRGDLDSALRLASRGTRIDLALPVDKTRASPAAVALAAVVSQANWRFALGGHDGTVNSAAFSPDGSRVATASQDGTTRIWDALSANQIAVLRGRARAVFSAAFSPDGSRIVTGSDDWAVRIWDVESAREIAFLFRHGAPVTSAAFSPDGSRIATASQDGTARIWDLASAKEIAILRHDGYVSSAAFSPDGSRLVTAGWDKTARVWDAATGKEMAVLRGHHGRVWSAAFNSDGSRIVTASPDKTARIWDAANASEIAVLGGHVDGVKSAAFSPDGSRIVTASLDKTVRIWDAASAKQIAVMRGHQNGVHSAAFSPDGSRIVTGSEDKTARIWEATTTEIAALPHPGKVISAAFSPDKSRIVTASEDGTVRIWDAANAREIAGLRGHQDGVNSAAFSPEGSRIVTASHDRTARIWDAASAKQIVILSGHKDSVHSAAFSPDGLRIVTASRDNSVRIWDAASGNEIAILRGHYESANSAAFNTDGSRIVTAANDYTGRIWDTARAGEIAILRGHESRVHSAAFSPDGSRIVTGSRGNIALIWDAASAKDIAILRGHEEDPVWGSVFSAVFSPDGSRIVTASSDKTARIWDAATGKEMAVLRGHQSSVLSAAFSPDGSRIVTASEDQTVRIWDVRLQTMSAKDLLAEACARLAGLTKLTRDEMRHAGYPDSMLEIDVCASGQ